MYFLIAIIVLLATFLAVVIVINLWLKYKTWHDEQFIVQRIYTRSRLMWLYVKCWAIVVSVLTIIFSVEMETLMMVLLCLLGLLALLGIIQGENLAEVKLLQSQGENQMLRSQLNPHFLYNTLNNIDALIWLDQEKASAAVTNLSELMRYFTYSAKQDQVQLGEELANLDKLVALQRLRMPSPSSLSFCIDVDNPKVSIAPLLLLPLMENSFKHCGNLNEEGAIRMEIGLHDGILEYRCNNNVKTEEEKDPTESQRKHGIGLKVLRRRLDLLYDGRYSLITEKADNRFVTYLQVEL